MKKLLIIFLLSLPCISFAQWFPVTYPNTVFTNRYNIFTASQYFQKLICDTMVVNHIDSVHSTYWYSNSGDTIGYIDAATEKVAFFKQMTIGNLSTSTTVAENFIRSNQVQTDTIYPHSPLILAGDTTIAKKLFADTVRAKTIRTDTIIIANRSIYPTVNHTGNIGTINNHFAINYFDTLKTKIISGYDNYTYFESSPYLLSGNIYFMYNGLSSRMESYGCGTGRGVTVVQGFGTYGQSDYQNFFVLNKSDDAVYNYNGIRIGYSADSVGHIESVAKGQYGLRPLVIKADTINTTVIKIIGGSSTATPSAGQIYYSSSDNHFYGYNGTIWKQLDN